MMASLSHHPVYLLSSFTGRYPQKCLFGNPYVRFEQRCVTKTLVASRPISAPPTSFNKVGLVSAARHFGIWFWVYGFMGFLFFYFIDFGFWVVGSWLNRWLAAWIWQSRRRKRLLIFCWVKPMKRSLVLSLFSWEPKARRMRK